MKFESQEFPKSPGVYLMKDTKGRIIYVGKAKNLHARVKQYFTPGQDERPSIPFILKNLASIDTIVVSSEREALLLENTLIKRHQPKYNILLKDDRSYLSLKLTRHEWPMLQLVRYKGRPPKDGTYFGPYLNASEPKRLLEVINRSFPLRQCSDREFMSRTRPCILYQMKRCLAPCVDKCTKEEYELSIKHAVQFLQGKDKDLLKGLYHQMEEASSKLEFEKAAALLTAIKQIESALQEQQISSLQRIDLDAIGIFREADTLTIAQLLFREGTLVHVDTFHFHKSLQEDAELVTSFLLQHYSFKEEVPYEILTPFPIEDSEVIADILSEGKSHKVHLHYPLKGGKCALIAMAKANAESSFLAKKDRRAIAQKILLDLQEKLCLQHYPGRIECFDNSHLFGESAVSAMVVFIDGEKVPASYRKYKTVATDDYGAFYEVLMRRYKKAKEEDTLPDLLLMDGGKGQLGVAKRVFTELNIITVDILSIAKDEGRHDKGIAAEKIFHPDKKDPIFLHTHSPLLFFLQQIRDEAHRFVIAFHRQKRKAKMATSLLEGIPGIGPIKSKRLLRHFGSMKQICGASKEALQEVKGLSANDIELILALKKP